MSSFHSSLNVKRYFFAFLFLLLLAAVLLGCNSNLGDDQNDQGVMPDGLIGKWVFDSNNWYEIKAPVAPETKHSIIYTAIFSHPEWGDFDFSFEGVIEFVSNHSSSSGVLIVRYTKAAPDPNKLFTGIYYNNLRNNTVQLANAWDLANETSADTATLDEAISKFTRDNAANFVNWTRVSPYNRQ